MGRGFCALLFVLLSSLVDESHGGGCLQPHCDHEDPASCLLNRHTSWHCGQDEYCDVRSDKDGLDMKCKSRDHKQSCDHDHGYNWDNCYLHTPPSPNICVYCCDNLQCLRDLASQPPATDSGEHVVNGPGSHCYTSQCHNYDSLADCTAGQFQCGGEEFCDVSIRHDGEIHMQCKPVRESEDCQKHQLANPAQCDQYGNDADCRYCCYHHDCIRQRLPSSNAQTATPKSSTTTTTTTTMSPVAAMAAEPQAGKHSCFTTDCDHHPPLHTCLQGQWACTDQQFCQIDLNHEGGVKMECQDSGHFDKCQSHRSEHNLPVCSTPWRDTPQADCRYCCNDSACVYSIPGNASATTTATHSSPAFTAETTVPSLATSSVKPGCTDMYAGDCATDYADQCSDHVVQTLCPATCRICTPECEDKLEGNCSVVFPGQCGNRIVREVCSKTCNTCHSQEEISTTTVPSTTPDTTTEAECRDHYKGDCSADFPGMCSVAEIAYACSETCGLCSNASSTPSYATTTEVSTVTDGADLTTTSTTPPTTPTITEASTVTDGADLTSTTGTIITSTSDINTTISTSPAPPTITEASTVTDGADLTATTGTIITSTSDINTTIFTSPAPQEECQDIYTGDCMADFPGMCSDKFIAQVCRRSCGGCSSSSSTAVTATITEASTVTDGADLTSTLDTSSTTTTDTNTTTSTSPAPPLQCVQCGDYSSQRECSRMELLQGRVKPCADPSALYCMTDILVHIAGHVSMYKRCVGRQECLNNWYLQTSDKSVCLHFDPVTPTPDLSCHFCCVGDACNTDTIPADSTLWRP